MIHSIIRYFIKRKKINVGIEFINKRTGGSFYKTFLGNSIPKDGLVLRIGAHDPYPLFKKNSFNRKNLVKIRLSFTGNLAKLLDTLGKHAHPDTSRQAVINRIKLLKQFRVEPIDYTVTKIIHIRKFPLSKFLATSVKNDQGILLLYLDSIKYELSILRLNNWDVYVPSLIIIKTQSNNFFRINKFLVSRGYILTDQDDRNSFFVNSTPPN